LPAAQVMQRVAQLIASWTFLGRPGGVPAARLGSPVIARYRVSVPTRQHERYEQKRRESYPRCRIRLPRHAHRIYRPRWATLPQRAETGESERELVARGSGSRIPRRPQTPAPERASAPRSESPGSQRAWASADASTAALRSRARERKETRRALTRTVNGRTRPRIVHTLPTSPPPLLPPTWMLALRPISRRTRGSGIGALGSFSGRSSGS
jgi:hypothetical protein